MEKVGIIVTVIAVLLLGSFGVYAYRQSQYPSEDSQGNKIIYWTVSCNVEILNQQRLLGFWDDDVELKSVSCQKVQSKCGWSTGWLMNKGEVCMEVDGVQKQCKSYTLWEGTDDTKTLSADCVIDPKQVVVKLYDVPDGEARNEYEGQRKVVSV